MPRSKPRKPSGQSEVIPHLNKQERVDELLKIQLETFPQKELTAEEIERWQRDLDKYPIQAIEWAFDNWRRNGRFFPVPADILDQCEAWQPNSAMANSQCSIECRLRHGKGYGESDMLWLWKRFTKLRNELQRPLTDQEHESLLDELDKVRGKSPEWRGQAA